MSVYDVHTGWEACPLAWRTSECQFHAKDLSNVSSFCHSVCLMGLLTIHVELFIWLSSNQLYCSVFIITEKQAFLPLFRRDSGDETRALIKRAGAKHAANNLKSLFYTFRAYRSPLQASKLCQHPLFVSQMKLLLYWNWNNRYKNSASGSKPFHGVIEYVCSKVETNKPSVLWMHVQRLDIRLASEASTQVPAEAGPRVTLWGCSEGAKPWLTWTTITNAELPARK